VDVTDPGACEAMVAAAVSALGPLQAAFNVHGATGAHAPVGESDADE